MLKIKDLKGKKLQGTNDIDGTSIGDFKEFNESYGTVFLTNDLEFNIHDLTHIDDMPVTVGYEFRAVEMFYGTGDDSGTWSTEYVDIPFDTDDDKVESVAKETYRNKLQQEGASVQILGVYAEGDPNDGHEFGYDIVFYPCEDVKFIEANLMENYRRIGIDKPSNHDEILKFVVEDVMETADNVNWHSGDVDIAFRRWIESK